MLKIMLIVYAVGFGIGLLVYVIIASEYGYDTSKDALMWFGALVFFPLTIVAFALYGAFLGIYKLQLVFQRSCMDMAKEYLDEVKDIKLEVK